MNLKNKTLPLTIILISLLNTSAFSSCYSEFGRWTEDTKKVHGVSPTLKIENPPETEESRIQKIQYKIKKINKKYDLCWHKKKKHCLQEQTLAFFQNCLSLWVEAIEYPLKVFSTCSPQEAQELITITQSLSKVAQNEKDLPQAYLLRDIAAIDPEHRPLFIKQLKRFTEKKLLGDFYLIPRSLKKCKPDQYIFITDLVLKFFENSPKLWTGEVTEPLKIFLTFSPQEAQELIIMTQSLSKAVQDENSFHQASLLKYIATSEKLKQADVHFALLKVAHRFKEGGNYFFNGFYQLYREFVKLDSSQYEWMADLIIKFGASGKNSNKLSISKGKNIIQAFGNLSSETQPLFSTFLEVNQVTNFKWAHQLAQTPPSDWAKTLRSLRSQSGLGHQPVIEVNTQTVHETQKEIKTYLLSHFQQAIGEENQFYLKIPEL